MASTIVPQEVHVRLKRPIVPIEQWMDDPFYVGKHAGQQWPFWKEHAIAFSTCSPPQNTLVVTGSNRGGKTFNVIWFMLRIIYEISCFWDFPVIFGLSAATKMLFVFLSLRKEKARSAGIDKIIRLIEDIPYFNEVYPYDKRIKTKVIFPGLEITSGSDEDDLLSEDLFGVIFDEANFTRAKAGDEYAKAKTIFMEAKTRGKMTYSIGGRNYGFYALISSAVATSSFVEAQVRLAEQTGDGYVVRAAVYSVKPWAFSSTTFKVFCGLDDVPPHIVDEVTPEVKTLINKTYGSTYDDFLRTNAKLLEDVPQDFLSDYQQDIVHCLRFISGRAMNRTSLFLKNRKAFEEIFNPHLRTPLLVNTPTLSLADDDMIQDFVDEGTLMELYDSGTGVYVHYDLGLRGDVTGSKGDFVGFAASYMTEANKIRLLLYMRIARRSSSDEIDMAKVEGIIYWLQEVGINIKLVTKDLLARGYFSQNLERRLGKERVANLSLDKSDVPFLTFSYLMKKKVIEAYAYQPFIDEFPLLIHDDVSRKVLKPDNGHDDISQAVIGSVYGCFQGEGLNLEALAVDEAISKANSRNPTGDDFYGGALNESVHDDFYASLLQDADEESEKKARYDSAQPEDEVHRRMGKLEKEQISRERLINADRDLPPRSL